MKFDDLLGLIIFLGIVIISSIFRGLKEMKRKDMEKTTKPSPSPTEGKFKEPERNLPRRKVIIRKETKPISSAPPVFIPFPETVESKEDMFEKMEEGEKQVLTQLDTKNYEEPLRKEKPPVIFPKKDKDLIKITPKTQINKEQSAIPKVQKVTFSAPMARASTIPQYHSSISLKGNIGTIPKLQWAFIMMEVLSPPKALQDE
ncbi:MAG: hypothetical protein ACP5UA_05475 [Candidatus Hydrogenedens sp.]